jgi:hypothetical protein
MTRYSIIKADIKQNRNDIVPLLQRNLKIASPQRYAWNYEQCPYGSAHCWLVKDEQSNFFIGSATLFPRKILVKDKPLHAGIAGDFSVDKKFRVFSPALKLQKEIKEKIQETEFKFIYGIPNEQSKTLFLKIGYKKIGRVQYFIKPLKSKDALYQYLHPYLRLPILSKTIDFFIKIFAKENRYKKTWTYSIEMPEFFDDRFDILWKKASKQFTIISERTSTFLNWRYIQSTTQDYKIFCLINEKKEILGYIVYYIENNMCSIMDLLVEHRGKILDSLLAEFLRYIRKKEVGSISTCYLGDRLLERKLREFHFLPVNKVTMDLIIYSPNPSEYTYLLNKKNWYFFAGDNDI